MNIIDVRPNNHSSFQHLKQHPAFDQAQAFFKFKPDYRFGRDRAKAGELFWALVAIEIKAGPAILQPQVRGLDGELYLTPPGILLFMHWPGAEALPKGIDPLYFSNGVAAFTEGKGNVGWGYGREAHIGADGGPFAVWCSSDPAGKPDRAVGSDALTKVGWFDDHVTPNPIFQLTRKGGQASGDYALVLEINGIISGRLQFAPEIEAAQKLVLLKGTERLGELGFAP